ncbi:MFS transporter [Youhaiella tibetensis]|uniref:MFS transporter n=1 Tax=Paradevosia tibetensis TaxID=1447062 RepID=A0A5B9DTX3_9HYPH|nr:MFS transporter [Youhaiella tibetensis]QEE22617.1 MFS transporter [Youhaiella tibetensis]GGF40467.1 MFS transporter [Youhaiella tibetensis]
MIAASTSTGPARAAAREWTGLAVLALPSLLVSIDVSVMVLALPHMSAALGADSAQQLWIMDIYSFMLAGFMITMGTLGDRIGRRRLLMFGGAGFGLASILAAFAPSAGTLIAARAVLGLAGATMSPSILALITNMFRDPAQRGFAISIWMVCFMAGMTVGPLVGGFMLEHFWWGSVFLLGVPVMVLLLVAAPFLLPEYRDPAGGRLDLLSVVLSLLSILPVVYGLKEMARLGIEPVSLGAIAVGLGFSLAFIARQRRLADPLFDLGLFSNRAFTTAVGGMFGITSTGAIMLYTSQYFQLVLGLSPLHAGLWGLPGVLAMTVMLMVSPILAQRVRPAPLIATSLVVGALGAFLITRADLASGVWPVVVGFMLFNGGCAPMVTLANGIVMSSVRPEKAGSAAGLSETCAEFGFALGIAILGSIGTAIYRSQIAATAPAGLPHDLAAAIEDTFANASVAASQLPADLGNALMGAASAAFVSGMHVVATICAITLLAVAMLVMMRLRHLPPIGATASEPAGEGSAETIAV